MSKYLYVIIPLVLMGLFIGVYIHESKAMEVERARQAEIQAQKDKEEAEHTEALRKKSAEEARIAQEKRDADTRAKEAEKEAAVQRGLQLLRDETAKYVGEQDKFKAQIADLEKQLTALRTEKENLSRQSIEMNQTIVAALIDRQNAEMDVQRFAAQVAQRVTNSPMVRPPATTPGQ